MPFAGIAVYAFVAWIASICAYLLLIIWSLSTKNFLHYIGVTYYPNRDYAIALPSYIIIIYILSGIIYMGINLFQTFDPEDIRTVKDSQSRNAPNKFIKCDMNDSIPEIGDMDLNNVSVILTMQMKNIKPWNKR
jgi:phosphatidylinositol glycan class P protein